MESLYEKLGGEAAVNAAVELFYNKVLNDPHIQHFFEHTIFVSLLYLKFF